MNPRSITRSSYTVAGLLALVVAVTCALTVCHPDRALAFPEETETQGEIQGDLNGVWLVVHHLKFNRPTPQATPAAGEKVPTSRIFNVLNLLKITHLDKDAAQGARDARAAQLEASIAKAKAQIAKDAAAQKPADDGEGEIEGGPRVVVPQVPRPPGYDPAIHSGDKVRIQLIDVDMPTALDDAFQAAQKKEVAYEPSDKDLAVLRSSWQSLVPKKDTEYNRIEWKIVAPEFYDQGLKSDPKLKDTKFTITGTQGMVPRPSQPDRNIVVYGIREDKDGVMSGTHSRAIMATAPFPIPIEMNGMAKFIKIADLPKTEGSTSDKADKAEKKGQPAS